MKLTDLFRMRPLSVENFTREDIKEQYDFTEKVLRITWSCIAVLLAALLICVFSLRAEINELKQWNDKYDRDKAQDSLLMQQQELLKDSV